MDIKETLQKINYSLNGIEVKGKSNLDILLGCMLTIDNLLKSLDATTTQEVPENPSEEDILDLTKPPVEVKQ